MGGDGTCEGVGCSKVVCEWETLRRSRCVLGNLGFLGSVLFALRIRKKVLRKGERRTTSLTVDEGPFYTFSRAPWSTTLGHHELQLDKP